MKFTDCVKVAYLKGSAVNAFVTWLRLVSEEDVNPGPLLHGLHRCVSECPEIIVEADSTTLTPADGDPDDETNGIQGATITWTWRQLSITLHSDGSLLAEGDEEVTA